MEDYVTYEQAKKLKELGFDWKCNHYYQDNDKSFHQNFYENHSKHSKMQYIEDNTFIKVTLCSAATLAQAQKWLREIHNIEMNLKKGKLYYEITVSIPSIGWIQVSKYKINPNDMSSEYFSRSFDTYEEALSAGIDKALELLK